MVSQEEVERQLNRIGCNYRLWGHSELAELKNILMDAEQIAHCVNGHYEGGFGLLVATDHRVLMIDRKPMNYLKVVDIRFETITEFDFHNSLFQASVHICTAAKTIMFVSWNQHRLRTLLHYVQQRVIEIRQYYSMAQQFQAIAAQQLQQPQPAAFVPNMAQSQTVTATPLGQSISDAATTLGAYTYTKLPHFRRHQNRRIGRYAMPDEIYMPLSQVSTGA
ncbi:MAG TPA: PH domain-containing protein [Candidatus Saccharimonadales bacterium]|nr:PH domain-containing protein [Candidatus Saccharimonadales bacterium]